MIDTKDEQLYGVDETFCETGACQNRARFCYADSGWPRVLELEKQLEVAQEKAWKYDELCK